MWRRVFMADDDAMTCRHRHVSPRAFKARRYRAQCLFNESWSSFLLSLPASVDDDDDDDEGDDDGSTHGETINR